MAGLDGAFLDVAGGTGRHAFYFAKLGAAVTCIDCDLKPLQKMQGKLNNFSKILAQVTARHLDLVNDEWPYGESSVGAIINVHFLLPKLFLNFSFSLKPGGYLLVETVGGQGGNYLQLPQQGELKAALETDFDFVFYRERAAGPKINGAVAVRLLARRKNIPTAEMSETSASSTGSASSTK